MLKPVSWASIVDADLIAPLEQSDQGIHCLLFSGHFDTSRIVNEFVQLLRLG